MLNQIGQACNYADRFSRKVIVETDFPTSRNIRQEFSRYFISHDPDLILSAKTYTSQFDNMVVEPSGFTGRINSYTADYNNSSNQIAEIGSGLVPNFDLKKNYAAPLLLRHTLGGGLVPATVALKRLSLTHLMLDQINARLSVLGKSYTGLHVRNTDYKTDYQDSIIALKEKIIGNVFVATDNREVVDFCREVLGAERVFSFSKLPDIAGFTTHYDMQNDQNQANMDAISDLILLSLAHKLHYFPIASNGGWTPKYSGFSLLANYLHEHPKVLQSLMDPNYRTGFSKLQFKMQKKLTRMKHKLRRAFKSLKNHPPT